MAVARAPAHYGPDRVADDVDGRFDMLVLHLFFMIRRARVAGAAGAGLVQALLDCFVRDMDNNLREMGAGDIGVAKRVKYMVHALNGQLHSYLTAADEGPAALRAVLARTMFADQPAADAAAGRLAAYAGRQMDALGAATDVDLAAGRARMHEADDAYRAAAGERPA
ncbi:MAG: ubiquinol-cytochrome C chaperone family protein [Alphaproteobacteria bacterium]